MSPELRTSDYSSARLGRDTWTSQGSKWFLVSLFDTSSQTLRGVTRVRLCTSWSQRPEGRGFHAPGWLRCGPCGATPFPPRPERRGFSGVLGDKDIKQHVGFSDYQCRTAPAMQKHWYLVFGAYGLLRLDLLRSPLYQTWQRRLKTIGVALRRQSQALVEQMILACHRILSQGTHPEQLFKLLFGEAVYIA